MTESVLDGKTLEEDHCGSGTADSITLPRQMRLNTYLAEICLLRPVDSMQVAPSVNLLESLLRIAQAKLHIASKLLSEN